MSGRSSAHRRNNAEDRRAREVWADNLVEEMDRMRDIAEEYPYVALETHFPGIVSRPTGHFRDHAEYNYQMLKCNVDLVKVIRISFTFSDSKGARPRSTSTWAFNFHFDSETDLISPEALERLRAARGSADLDRLRTHGIDEHQFGELLTSSGIVLNEDVRWVSFSGCNEFTQRLPALGRSKSSGMTLSQLCEDSAGAPWVVFCGLYDFGCLLQLLTSEALPDETQGFFDLLHIFFPSRCDLARHLPGLLRQNNGHSGSAAAVVKDAWRILEAFFRLPEPVRKTAFDQPDPETVKPALTVGAGHSSQQNGCLHNNSNMKSQNVPVSCR